MSTKETGELAEDGIDAHVRAIREVFREGGAPLTTQELSLLGMMKAKGDKDI